jgi:hypothetical protein
MTPAPATGTLSGRTMPTQHIHVEYSDSGMWVVKPDDRTAVLSEHWSETAAERAAIAHAAGCDDCDVVVHDRYARVHVVNRRRFRRAGRHATSG